MLSLFKSTFLEDIHLETERQIALPHQLEAFRDKIQSSVIYTTLIAPSYVKPSLTDSKFAGSPYLPKTHTIPKDSDGNDMYLLAQINFSEVLTHPLFPKEGLIQFFISKKLCIMEDKVIELLLQQDFKVRFFPTILPQHQLVHDFSSLTICNEFPIKCEMGLIYSPLFEPVSATDYRLENYLDLTFYDTSFISEDEWTFEDLYLKNFLAADHKIGGYPYFIESDTRKTSPLLKRFDTLLLQIVSNDEQGIMFKDTGVIKFFIHHKNLQNLDFTSIYLIAEQY